MERTNGRKKRKSYREVVKVHCAIKGDEGNVYGGSLGAGWARNLLNGLLNGLGGEGDQPRLFCLD